MESALVEEAAVQPVGPESSLELELSLLHEEYFAPKVPEAESGNSQSESETSDQEQDDNCDSPPGPSGGVEVDVRELDKDEVENVKAFSATTCGCRKKHGLPCSTYFTEADIAQMRMSMAELERDQLDLVILGQIDAHHYTGKLVGLGCRQREEWNSCGRVSTALVSRGDSRWNI